MNLSETGANATLPEIFDSFNIYLDTLNNDYPWWITVFTLKEAVPLILRPE